MDDWLSKVLTDITNRYTIGNEKVKILLDRLLKLFTEKDIKVKQLKKGDTTNDRFNTTN